MWTTKDDTYGADYVETSMPNNQTFFKGSTAYYVYGGKLYYTSGTNAKLNYVRLYRANMNGSKAKQIGSFGDKSSDRMLVHDITTTSCTVQNYSNYDCFQFIYKTNELIPY